MIHIHPTDTYISLQIFIHLLGEDCSHCGPKVVTEDDVKDVEVPEWKKKALQQSATEAHAAAPFGLSWNAEASTTATDAHEKHSTETHHDHHHHHHHDDEHHSHGEH